MARERPGVWHSKSMNGSRAGWVWHRQLTQAGAQGQVCHRPWYKHVPLLLHLLSLLCGDHGQASCPPWHLALHTHKSASNVSEGATGCCLHTFRRHGGTLMLHLEIKAFSVTSSVAPAPPSSSSLQISFRTCLPTRQPSGQDSRCAGMLAVHSLEGDWQSLLGLGNGVSPETCLPSLSSLADPSFDNQSFLAHLSSSKGAQESELVPHYL